MTLDHPTVKKGSLWVFDIGNVMSKGLPEEGIPFDLLSALELRKKIESGKVMRSLGAGGRQYGRHEVDGGT